MIEHIAQELIDVAVDERSRNTAYHGYFQRKAADLLDMIEGFGMQPPSAVFVIDWDRWDPDRKEWYPSKERIHSNKWENELSKELGELVEKEPEDETK
jgi:hypothetical protein